MTLQSIVLHSCLHLKGDDRDAHGRNVAIVLDGSNLIMHFFDPDQPSATGFVTAMELHHQRKKVVRISTGSKQFDSILGG